MVFKHYHPNEWFVLGLVIAIVLIMLVLALIQ